MPEQPFSEGLVRGFLHEPEGKTAGGLVITHGASGNAQSPLLVAVANAFAAAGYHVLRIDLPYRQNRPSGSPHPSHAARDREGIVEAVQVMRRIAKTPVYAGGHSYGGRQVSMAAAENPTLAHALLLLSYPLHPPGKPEQMRTAHFPNLRAPVLFVHGTRDGFGSEAEMREALKLIKAPHELWMIPGGGHGLPAKIAPELPVKLNGLRTV
jgi:predicted alpha/beta-hydrolase family hydrolase